MAPLASGARMWRESKENISPDFPFLPRRYTAVLFHKQQHSEYHGVCLNTGAHENEVNKWNMQTYSFNMF